MRVLLASHLFAPSVGGIEQVSEMLAVQLSDLGCDVTVVTQTPGGKQSDPRFTIYRQPSRAKLLQLVRNCDVYLQSNLSLTTLWPAILLRKATMAVHHTWISRPDGRLNWQDHLKLMITRVLDRNLAVSKALADSIPGSCGVVPNPYRDDIFFPRSEIQRDRDLVFVGRLVSSKGADLLLQALAILVSRGRHTNLTIVGTGPEEGSLKNQVNSEGLAELVRFEGALEGDALGCMLNRHRILVAPSRWQEPFGLVALEGIASGCAVVASSGGGLPDAVGACGLIFPTGNSVALADAIEKLLTEQRLSENLLNGATEHLKRHKQAVVAQFYLRELSALAKR